MRTGLELRVSTPVMTASASANPRSLASSRGNAATRASDTNGGKHSRKSHQTTPRGYVGRTVRLGAPGRPAWKSPTVWAGAAYAAPPASRAARYAARSKRRCSATPASTSSPSRSSGRTSTSRALLAFSPSRAKRLMPFVHTPPSSLAAATTVPPGHMQNV